MIQQILTKYFLWYDIDRWGFPKRRGGSCSQENYSQIRKTSIIETGKTKNEYKVLRENKSENMPKETKTTQTNSWIIN